MLWHPETATTPNGTRPGRSRRRSTGKMIRQPDPQVFLPKWENMSDADDQIGGSGDPKWEPPASKPKEKPSDENSEDDKTS
jgi:hypothetical protein